MGCDVFYDGQLSNPRLQEKIIELVRSYYTKDYYLVRPEPETYYHTRFSWEKPSEKYPFNYFGVIPQIDEVCLINRGQFVFDRSDGGKLITLHQFPNSYTMLWDSGYENADSDVTLENGGYDRVIGAPASFIFLLTFIKIKWWPELSLRDDYYYSEEIMNKVIKIGLDATLKEKHLDFYSAWNLYLQATGQKNMKQKYDNKEDQSLFPEVSQKKEESDSNPDLRLVRPKPEEIRIEDMDLGIRCSRCLERSGVENLGQLLNYSKNDINAIKNLGRKCVEKIIRKVRSYGYELHADD